LLSGRIGSFFFPDRIELDFDKKEIRISGRKEYRVDLSNVREVELLKHSFGADVILRTKYSAMQVRSLPVRESGKLKSLITSYLWQYTCNPGHTHA
jgi:hypothetical protein